jgi:hypothetical protein
MATSEDIHIKLSKAWDDITSVPDVEEKDYEHYGMWVVEIDGEEWAIGTDDEAEEACADYIRDSLWAFRPEFLVSYVIDGIDEDIIKIIQQKCEDANDPITRLVGDRQAGLIEDAIAADGRGHFLSPYDGEEVEIITPHETVYAYRLN